MSSDPDLQICAWVKIGDTSEIDYEVAGDGQVEFSIGGCDEFLLVTSEYGLQNFVAHANEAHRATRVSRARMRA
ncbi:MAG: hypothetical protein ACT4NY_27470 [Pseudonocardiales bacterium]